MRLRILALALVLLAVAPGCLTPVPPADAGLDAPPPLDAPSLTDVADLDVGAVDGGGLDGGLRDAGTDAGPLPALTVVGGFGTTSGSVATGGTLTVVGGTFSTGRACSTSGLCVIGGFSR